MDDSDADDDGSPSLLIELAPFTFEFYVALTALVNEAYRPTTYETVKNSKDCNDDDDVTISSSTAVTTTNDRQIILHEALQSVEMYSLPHMHDATRITNILLALQNSNITTTTVTTATKNSTKNDNGGGDDDGMNYSSSSSFSLLLLLQSSTTGDGDKSNNSILSSLFHHWSQLSRMEGALRNLVKRYTFLLPSDSVNYAHYCNFRQGCKFGSGSCRDSDDTRTIPKSSSTTTTTSSFLSERALSIETLRSRFDSELDAHISSLRDLLSYIYLVANAKLRGKCRRWMGGWLRNFAYGGGSGANISSSISGMMTTTPTTMGGGTGDTESNVLGSSFVYFCPLLFATTTITTKTSRRGTDFIIPQTSNALGIEDTSACGVESLLRILLRIILGFRRPLHINDDDKEQLQLRASHKNLLYDVILPLHRPSGLVLWRDQTPIIGLYHETLTKIMGAFISFDRSLVGPVIGALLHPDIWPVGEGGNTPKVVLLLHEVDALLGLLLRSTTSVDSSSGSSSNNKNLDTDYYLSCFDTYLIPLIARLCSCISSENSRTSERALQFFRNSTFVHLVKRRLGDVGSILLRALCRCPSMDVPWNPTVRKMTLLVLQELEGYYIGAVDGQMSFQKACDDALFGINLSLHDNNNHGSSDTVDRSSKVSGTAHADTHSQSSPSISGNLISIRGAMGSWKPPPSKKTSVTGPSSVRPPPPLTVTGVAPWAVGGGHVNGVQKQPPVTITGVAPWAIIKQPTQHSIPRTPRGSSGQSRIDQLPSMEESSVIVAIQEDENKSQKKNNMNMTVMRTYLDEVRLYMAKLKPKEDSEESIDGVSNWAKAQMNESPVLLHNLKFHDLVFGQELGTGAFGTVKYARHIDKTKTRSSWPEYAVKVVSTQKIEEMGYERSINMEIAILGTLSHPGIARLISSFRFRDGAYLVLEYASGGDLHTLLRRNGSLDHDSTRFVIGSVAAALSSIHERGFVYVDCKPENVLITETGHIKVTDFGGCRPVTQEAKDMVKKSSKNLLKQLRDGDWRPNNHNKSSSSYTADRVTAENEHKEEGLRIEGTTAYLPPEVVIGGYPTTAADIWALGCVLFQCISGQPPILEDTDDLTVQKIVTFNLSSEDDDFFGKGGSTFRDDAKALIRSMLHRDASHRPSVNQIAESEFFEGIDIFTLHKNPALPLDVGSVPAPASDAKWARRQFSSIWAPQPRNYNISAGLVTKAIAGTFGAEIITEGDEADEEFLVGQNIPKLLLTKIRE
jgi:serine/threonine protein kinase